MTAFDQKLNSFDNLSTLVLLIVNYLILEILICIFIAQNREGIWILQFQNYLRK